MPRHGTHGMDGSANFLPARARRHADFSKLALPRRRTELVGRASRQPQLQFSAELEDAVVRHRCWALSELWASPCRSCIRIKGSGLGLKGMPAYKGAAKANKFPDLRALIFSGNDRLHAVAHMQFLEELGEVVLDGADGQAKLLGDLLVGVALGNMLENLLLAIGERGLHLGVALGHQGFSLDPA